MPSALEQDVKDRVKKLWLSGETRKNIAIECEIGAGSVTNIVNECEKNLESSDYESMREMAVEMKKQGLTFAQLGSMYRFYNYIKKLGVDLEQIESFIVNIVNSQEPQKLIDTANQIAQLSTSIPLDKMADHVKRQQDEIQKLDEEIEKAGVILQQKNIDIKTIEQFKQLEQELQRYALSMELPPKLVSILRRFKEMGYDPHKIVAFYTHVNSLEQKEWRLKNYCNIWESRAAEYQKIVPMCKRVVSMGIGIPMLLALETAVIKKIEEEGVPPESAPFQVMQDIEYYNRNGGMKKQLHNTTLQVGMVKEILARQNSAMNIFMKLQISGMTEDQILNLCKTIETNRHIMTGSQSTNSHSFSAI